MFIYFYLKISETIIDRAKQSKCFIFTGLPNEKLQILQISQTVRERAKQFPTIAALLYIKFTISISNSSNNTLYGDSDI